MKVPLFAILLCVAVLPLSAADMLKLKNKNGGEIMGTVEPGQKPGTINLVRSDGRLFREIPVTSFSLESQKKIADALAKYQKERENADVTRESRLQISFQRNKSANNNRYGDIDDRIVTIQPRVTLESDERDKTYKDIKGEVIVIGKEVVSRDRWVILDRQRFNFAQIKPDDRITWEGEEFECRYDPDYAGWDYEGHVVILRNKAGKIAMVKGSNSGWEQILPALMKARKGTGYNKEFSKEMNLRTTFGLPGTR